VAESGFNATVRLNFQQWRIASGGEVTDGGAGTSADTCTVGATSIHFRRIKNKLYFTVLLYLILLLSTQ
jgi:hypothetical protein